MYHPFSLMVRSLSFDEFIQRRRAIVSIKKKQNIKRNHPSLNNRVVFQKPMASDSITCNI
ncbi:MAG: hypothetical protein D6748_14380 [Calditrichaeota bacterium]|nr:MAG: hypothetical protein D6748_14380 [Calditrichota bacterium]